jgi:hypothetical protein
MFTALILMCASETLKFPDQCTVMTGNIFFETKEECEYDVMIAVASGKLTAINPNLIPVDYYCVDWSQTRV